jgi:hypothetical protein
MDLRNPWLRRLAAGLLTLILLVAPARAQSNDDEDTGPFQEPGIVYREDTRPYIPWLAASLLIAAVLLIAFKNPHRSHLD